jgi:hypothetical protein
MHFMALIGLVTTAGASIEDTLATIVARLAAPPARGKLAWEALMQRREKIARKPFAAKVDLLELVWPHRWTSVQPLVAELKLSAQRRNDAAHTWDNIDVGAVMRSGRPLDGIDLNEFWNRTLRNGQTKPVDLDELLNVHKELRALEGRLVTFFFVDHARDVPLDVAWLLRNGPGDFARIDKPEQQEGFAGWA